MRASICVLGPLLARCGEAKVALPGGDASARARSTCTSPGSAKLGAESSPSTATSSPGAGRADRRDDLARLPERRRDREPADGGGARQGHDGDRQRRPRAGDRRPLPDARADGRADRRRRHLDARDRGRRPAATRRATTRPRPDRRRHLGVRRGDDPAATSPCATRTPEHLEIALDKLVTAGAHVDWASDGFRVRMDRRPRSFDVVTLPYPGFATDLQPMVHRAQLRSPTARRWSPRTSSRPGSCSSTSSRGWAPTCAPTATTPSSAAGERLSGAPVRATDIRAGAGLVLAGLVADGVTRSSDVVPHRPRLPGLRRAAARRSAPTSPASRRTGLRPATEDRRGRIARAMPLAVARTPSRAGRPGRDQGRAQPGVLEPAADQLALDERGRLRRPATSSPYSLLWPATGRRATSDVLRPLNAQRSSSTEHPDDRERR